MENVRALPTLGIVEAIRLAAGRLLDFKGRSRRSEFWWWIGVALLLQFAIGYLPFLDGPTYLLIDALIMACALSVTVRRLHDIGRRGIWVYISFAMGVITFIYTYTSKVAEFFKVYIEKVESYGGELSEAQMEILKDDIFSAYATPLMIWYILLTLWGISSITVAVFCMTDGTQEKNKYGSSPKYVVVGNEPQDSDLISKE